MRKYIISFFSIIMFLSSAFSVNATPGNLKSSTIKKCDNIYYGQHSSDNHWHKASKNSDGSWSAVGPVLINVETCNPTEKNPTGWVKTGSNVKGSYIM